MATLRCSNWSESSLTFTLSGMTSGKDYGHSRTFTWECDGQEKTTTVSDTSTATSISKSFSGLESGTTYTCYLSFTDLSGHTYEWEADGTTDNPTPPGPRMTVATQPPSYSSIQFGVFLWDASPTYSGNMYARVTLNNHSYSYELGEWGGVNVVWDIWITGLSDDTVYNGDIKIYDKNKNYTGQVAQVSFITPKRPIPQYTMRIATYLNGTICDSVDHTQNEFQGLSIGDWLYYFENSFGLEIPDGYFEYAIVDNDPVHEKYLDDHVDLYDDHVIIAYYKTVKQKAYIYTGTGSENGWAKATPYIFNGSTWVEAMPNIYDGGWK